MNKSKSQGAYLNLLDQAKLHTDIPAPASDEIISRFHLSPQYSGLQGSLLYIVDYARLKYSAVSTYCDHYLGYPTDYLKDAGPAFYVSLWHKDDFRIYNEQIMPEVLRYLKEYNCSDASDILVTLNYRVRNKKGNYIKIRQRSVFLQMAPNCIPLAAIGTITDISSFMPDANMFFSMEKLAKPGIPGENTEIIKTVYYPDERDGLLTKREIEVLKWICEGFSSQQIAGRLNNSIHTINNHRKNILRKTNAKNVIEVITYAIRNQIL
jgi:DNA-binding CsgD family transcriptional regulator